ncbi:MAG: VWA domain-containing protein, partial [Desulfobacca sp.]|nr:VWA domain-containing protein [Desulfobacca sp.]
MLGGKSTKYQRLILMTLLSLLILGGLPIQSPGLELVVALDTSGSMKQNDPHQLLPQAVRLLITLVQPQDRLGILTFEDGAALKLPVLPLTPTHHQQSLAELKKLAPRGLYTDLYAALDEGLKAFPDGDPTPPRALILLTDGQMDINPQKGQSADFTARLIQEILPQYQERKIPIYAVAFTEQSDQKFLQQLAAQTGGRFLLVQQAADLYLAFATIYEELEHPQLAPVIGDQFMIDANVQEATLIISRAQPRAAVGLID